MIDKELTLGFRTWIEIDTKAIEHNYKIFRALVPATTKLMSVVKSNAYGHGLVDFSKTISKAGIDWLAVDSIVEAFRLRKEGIDKPILVLGYTLPEHIQQAISENISITISNLFTLSGLKDLKLEGKIKAHIKIDTGMHRQGFMEYDQDVLLKTLQEYKNVVEVEGLYTHFASAKDPLHSEYTNAQIMVFKKWIDVFKQRGYSPLVHAGATGATLLYPHAHFDMARVGVGFHGIWPSKESQIALQEKYILKPTLTWKTIISEIKKIPAGEKVGYSFTEETLRETMLAICPIGYWHGFPKVFSSIGTVLIHGKYAKVMGRVSMDMIVVDVTDIPNATIGDHVVLIGESEGAYLGARDIAEKASIDVYELVTRINPLIKKIYI